jgi:hypothetical protein
VVVLLVLPVLLVVAGRGGALSEPPLSRGLAKQVGGKEEEEQLLLGKVGAKLVLVTSDHNTLHPPPLQQRYQQQQQLWGNIPSLGALYLPVHSVRREAAKVLRVCGGESPRQRPDPLPPGVDILVLLLVRPKTFNTPLAGWVIVGLC